MASASTFIRKSFKYDVFLSFRGEDTRTNFVDHLYYALQHKGIHTYKDDERIKKGKKINDELIRSIEDSKFYIIVFSKNYSSSSWCLNELVKIMECNNTGEHTAYPVFYDVGPSEVRKQSGTVEKSIANHENEEVDGKWREALREAADLAGWELKNTADSHEAKFIQKIVEELSLELRAINFNIDDKLVGMETRINDILASLGNDFDDVRMIGIKGIGGGGKTTLARAVFDQISFQFECRSFVENVREVSKASLFGLKTLQKKILFDVFREKDISIDSVYDGINMMRRRMPGIKVLLVLDDVDHIEQLEALAGEMKWFKPGSRIVITTRDEQVLVAHGVNSIHNVQLLLDEEAIRLFSRYAFGRVIPNTGYEEPSRQVIRYAAGLPLTIRVLGSFLCGKSDLEWIDALERLKTIPLMETLKKLELSYISLEDDYKEIFLNVACILKGSSIAFAIKALESCKFHARNGLRVLEQKSLITIDRGLLGMHDHVEEMGMNIVRRSHPDNPEKQSRLWIYEELEDILTNDMGTKATRYIRLHMEKLSPEVVMKGLRKMTGLRFLDVEFFGASKSDCSRGNQKLYKFPNSLRYLRWTHYCFSSLPKTFQANNIVALEMPHSRIVQLWEVGGKKVLNKLRFLDLSYSMVKSLDLGLTPNIETLNLEGCCELVELHMFAECTKLIIVNLKSSTLRTLNLGSTTNIEQLDLERCLDLVELHMPGEYPNLRSLNLSKLKLRILDIGSTPNLEYLDLEYCCHLEQFHMADECHKLTSLIISHSKLKYLDLGLTPSLKTLNLQNCYNLVEIHVAYECLKNLIYLDLSGCLRFTSFKFHIWIDTSCSENKSFPLAELHLVAMSLDGCPVHPNNSLPKFQFQYYYKEDKPLLTRNLEKLLSVGLCACTNLDTFSRSICGLQYLRKLKLEGGILEPPRELNLLECLEELDFSYTKVKDLPDSICMLKHLESLKINHCWYLEKLPDYLGRLECLKKVTLKCAKIKSLPDSICMLKHLESLKLYWCSSLEMLPEDLGRLECLKKLTIRSAKIKDLPGSICMLKHLESLELDGCWNLEKLPGDLGRLLCLKKLNLSFCKLLRDIPDSICNMKYLKYLNLWYCAQLEKLPEELGCLECLEILDITYTSISHLPQSIYLLKGLRIFGWLRNNKSFHVGYNVGN